MKRGIAHVSISAIGTRSGSGSVFQTDRYRIKRVLGQQRGRPTLLAHDQETGDPVVIKGMLFGPGFDWSDLKLFEREAQVLQKLDHPAIPRYRDFYSIKGDFGGGMALVQSYIEAPSLQSLWDQGHRFTRAEILHIARSVLKILQYLHGFHPLSFIEILSPATFSMTPSP
ncbi:MAG: serine/threonine protein kinase, partial [Synechococcaceae cyanobacterium RM1_1_27]|nr:serine/threonine protein kinase [Synechococcaceae cyanobacterium RM1_1_27]